MPPKLGRFAERERARLTKAHKKLVDAAGKNALPPAPKKRARPRAQKVGEMAEAQRKKATEQAYLPPNETISSSYATLQKKRGKPGDLGVYRFTTAYDTRAEKAAELGKAIEQSRHLHGDRAIQDAMEEARHLSAVARPPGTQSTTSTLGTRSSRAWCAAPWSPMAASSRTSRCHRRPCPRPRQRRKRRLPQNREGPWPAPPQRRQSRHLQL